jgi:hypothetical protein
VPADDEEARRRRAEELRRAIDEAGAGRPGKRPASPREFTDEKAGEAAEEERRRAESGDEEGEGGEDGEA